MLAESNPLSEELEIPIAEQMEPLLTAETRFLGAHGGRGGMKSWFFAGLMIARMVRDQSLRAVCFREVQGSLEQSVYSLLKDEIKRHHVEDYFEIRKTEIRAAQGDGVILFRGLSEYTKNSIKSFEGIDIAWLEEAQTISKDPLALLLPTIRKDGAQIWASWNPVNETDPIDVLLRGDDRIADSTVVEVNYLDNPWCPKSLIAQARYCQATDPEAYGHIWLGQYVKYSKARVFQNWKIEEFEAPKSAIIRQGVDWGFSPDPTVLLRGYIEGRKLYIDYEAYETECEIEDTAALFLTVPDSNLWPMLCASDRPERVTSIRRAGFRAQKAIRETNCVEEGVAFLKGLQIIVHPRCKNTIAELRLYSRKVDPLTGKVLPILEDKNNHCIDAMRYLVDEVRRLGRKPADEDVTPEPVAHHW